ncbi:MAG: hypothetical protein DMD58_11320, partial [Gemmatimonadetes bacterium]
MRQVFQAPFTPPLETQPVATIRRAVHQLDQCVRQAFGARSFTAHNFAECSLCITDLAKAKHHDSKVRQDTKLCRFFFV